MKLKLIVCVLALALFAIQSQASADVIYDGWESNGATNSFTTTGSTPRNFMADGFSTLAPVAGNSWLVDTVGIRIFVVGSGVAGVDQVYNDVTLRVRIYNDWDPATAVGSVFSGLASDVTFDLGTVTNDSATGGNLFFSFTFDYLGNGDAFVLTDGQNMGLSVELLENGVANQGLATLLRAGATGDGVGDPAIGTSPNGWYRDANANGIIESTDGRIFGGADSNAHFKLEATQIPEPGMASLIGLVMVGGFVSRRRK